MGCHNKEHKQREENNYLKIQHIQILKKPLATLPIWRYRMQGIK
jgi:hypothetical protein